MRKKLTKKQLVYLIIRKDMLITQLHTIPIELKEIDNQLKGDKIDDGF